MPLVVVVVVVGIRFCSFCRNLFEEQQQRRAIAALAPLTEEKERPPALSSRPGMRKWGVGWMMRLQRFRGQVEGDQMSQGEPSEPL